MMDINLIVAAVAGIAGGFALRGWFAHQEATAKARALRAITKALSVIDRLDTNKADQAALVRQEAADKAELDALKTRVAALT